MPSEFTSHQFFQRLAHDNQRLYIEALYPYRDSPAPFRALHVELAHALKHFNLEQLGKIDSTNIFGDPDPCEKWRRL